MKQKLQVIRIWSCDLGSFGAQIFGPKARYSLYQSVCLKVSAGSMPHDLPEIPAPTLDHLQFLFHLPWSLRDSPLV